MIRKSLLILTISTFIFLSSCTSKVGISIKDNLVTIDSKNSYSPSLVKLIDDFNSVLNEKIVLENENRQVVDIDNLALELSDKEHSNELIKISDIGNKKKRYDININVGNYERLSKIFPLLEDENIMLYSAKANKNETRESYLEIIDFVFGSEFKTDLSSSFVNITFKTDGKISDVVNAKIIDENTICCSIPVLDIALLKDSIEISFTIDENL